MVIDTSAIIAVLLGEPDAERFQAALLDATDCRMSAFNVFETRAVLVRRSGDPLSREFELLLVKLPVDVVAFDAEQATLAFEAWQRFGKGSGHPAQLNLGDCAAYALAVSSGLPLLFKDDDFARTDVVRYQ